MASAGRATCYDQEPLTPPLPSCGIAPPSFPRLPILLHIVLGCALASPAQTATEATNPAKTIRIVVPTAVGGWLALGLHRRRLPHMLSTQPYPMQPDGDWIDQQVRSFKLRDP